MASRSSSSGKRRRPGQRTEKERRASQGPAPVRGSTAGQTGDLGQRRGERPGPRAQGVTPANPDVRRSPESNAASAGPVPAGATLIYGRNPLREALRGRRGVQAVWLLSGTAGDDLERALVEWAEEAGRPVPEVRRASAVQLLALAGSPDHQGLVGAVGPYGYIEPEEVLRDHTLLVALDEVQDPHNLGAIIRTAEGAGAGVVIPRHRSAEVTAAVVKAAAGATEHAAIAQVRNLADFLREAKEAGFWVYGAAAGSTAEYTAQDYRYPTIFVVGSEGQGLGRRVESLCDVMVRLPLQGKVDSLNVSVSTGILLYEAVRQRRAAAGEGEA